MVLLAKRAMGGLAAGGLKGGPTEVSSTLIISLGSAMEGLAKLRPSASPCGRAGRAQVKKSLEVVAAPAQPRIAGGSHLYKHKHGIDGE